MESKNLDIVYFVKETPHNEELRYSLRSVDLNLPHKRVWIFGGCPTNIIPDVRVRVDQVSKTKWDNVHSMYKMVCENKEITDNFIMFNDDFFIMKPTDKIEPLYRCALDEHIKILEPTKPSAYSKLLRACRETLTGEPLSYELHTPFIFNKKKLMGMLTSFPGQHCTRTMYGNIYNIGGERANDVKIFNSSPTFNYKSSQFLSTDDPVININNDIWRWLQKQFPKKSRFEV